MDNQEHMRALSRDEYIRMARESCNRNAGYNSSNSKNHGTNKNKGYLNSEKFRTWDQAAPVSRHNLSEDGLNMTAVNIKSLLIRTICALILFLTVFIFDKFDLKVNTFNTKYIQDMVTSNQSINQAEDYFVSLFEKFVKKEE
ncbi:hypothetical protein [Anaerocolumna sp. MB42-C2]|uniref:hypothetical protein n=1 Tax=Anaerocolumna sp. MB42-C2 TaxID=3070997 RepID=UPI0027DFE5A6|nr:hypothetical protein [Anaerocolumna sp. MB42-C2]WMJ88137.1 hypothetical protein RBU59_01140 [Anaerocolumna sp. MB42-C2]